jgi:hypothetical protein
MDEQETKAADSRIVNRKGWKRKCSFMSMISLYDKTSEGYDPPEA